MDVYLCFKSKNMKIIIILLSCWRQKWAFSSAASDCRCCVQHKENKLLH